MTESVLARKIKARTAEKRLMKNPVRPSSCVTPAGTSNELMSRMNGKKTHIHKQHNGGFLPGIILLTQCYYHRGTRLNAMKRFRICSL